MKKITTISGALCSLVLLTSLFCTDFIPAAYAVTPAPTTITVGETPPPASAPDIIVTSIAGSALPDYLELYNQSDKPINLHGWSVQFTMHDKAAAPGCADVTADVTLPDAWLLSKKFLTLQRITTPDPASLTVPFFFDTALLLAGCVTPQLATINILDVNGQTDQSVNIPAAEWSATSIVVAQHKQRTNSPNSTRSISGVFDTDYKIVTGAISLNSDPQYMPPADTAGLELLEILPNAKNCQPLTVDLTCNDYVKLYNPTDQPINLALYRLRAGAKGLSESVTNTFTWNQAVDPANDGLLLPPHAYFMLTSRNDGQPLSITDGGNYIWLEDAYGTTLYEPFVQYPDASSTTKVGQSWAFDGTSWRWTTAPQPGAANYFPPAEVLSDSTTNVLVDILKPCASNQYRNATTNRCNSITTATATLAPCGSGEERNPDTNRCRSIATEASQPAPCPAGSERNPQTNRCRKIPAAATASAVEDVAAPASSDAGWFVAAIAGLLALSYAIYEWRQEIRLLTVKIRNQLLTLPERFRR